MKFLLLLFTLPLCAKTVCLNMIVKDESPVIERCLNSVKPFIDSWVIVDTGSTDGTQDKIRRCMGSIPGELHERPWVDFAHNRNQALELAKGKGDYVLFLDADEQLVFAKNFQKPVLDRDFYLVMSDNQGFKYGRIQLINNHLPWVWEGCVHECIESLYPGPKTSGLLAGVTNVISWDGNRSKDPDKYKKDAVLLEQALRKNPGHKRTLFYLARSYQDAKEPEKALRAFEQRAVMLPWDPEVHWSLYQIALLQEQLGKPRQTVIEGYHRAYQNLPTRAEPLYHLARYYNQHGEPFSAYLTAQHALSIPKPMETMFLETWIYDFGLLWEFATSAHALGKYDEAQAACVQLLLKPGLPEGLRENVEKNLRLLIELKGMGG